MNFYPKRMPVHAGALVPFWHIGQAVSCLDLKNAKYIHGRIVPSAECLRNNPVAWIASAGLETHPGMRAIAKGFAGRLTTTA
jgi:hypothetical protein